MNENKNCSRVALEDLLKLKRAERPPAGFWAEFDGQLRRKQLAAIVDTRPWWRRVTTMRGPARLCVPLGATAALVFAIGSVCSSPRSPVPVAGETISGSVAAVAVTAVPAAQAALRVDAPTGKAPAESMPVAVLAARTQGATAGGTNAGAPEKTAEATRASSSLIAANPATPAGSEPTPVKVFENLNNLNQVSAVTRSAPAEPLAQMATPGESRRSRLLAYSVAMDPHAPDNSDAVRSRERITRRLSDQALYDSISRLDLTGQSLSIRF